MIIDINYSTQNVEGTGTVIANDLNASEYCEDSDFTDSTSCSYEWDISSISDGNYYVNMVIDNGDNQLFEATDDNFMIDNSDPEIYSIVINNDNNLDGIDYDLNATIIDSSTVTNVTYKCYSNENEETCVSESWDCHLGNMISLGGNDYGVHIDSSSKDKIGTWYCKIFAEDLEGHQSFDSESAVMDIVLSLSVDSLSGTYSGSVNTTENAIYTDQNKNYVIITNSGNSEVDATLQTTELEGEINIPFSNQKWSIADVYSSSIPFTGGVDMVKTDLGKGTFPNSGVFNLYYWLDIPNLLPSGEYTGIMVYGVSS